MVAGGGAVIIGPPGLKESVGSEAVMIGPPGLVESVGSEPVIVLGMGDTFWTRGLNGRIAANP